LINRESNPINISFTRSRDSDLLTLCSFTLPPLVLLLPSYPAMSSLTPPFDSLPLKKDGPRGNAWGLFGAKDELGMLNRLTAENTLAATKEIQHGIRVCTDWALDQPKAPCFNRAPFEHKIHNKAPRCVNDDTLSLNTQSSTQWDGFRHFGMRLANWVHLDRSLTCVYRISRP
jgi:hypothetical protein